MTPFIKGRKRATKERFGKWEGLIENNLKTVGKGSRTRIFASASSLCPRQTAGSFFLPKGHEVERKASTQFYFKLGNAIEDVMADGFLKSGTLIDRETRIEAYHDELPVSGRIDFVLEDPETAEVVLMELKSCGKLPAAPKHAHVAQLMTYLVLTGMPKGLIWYVSRNVADWTGRLSQKVFEITPTEEDRRATVLKIAIGALAAKKGLLPDIPEEMKKYRCGFCTLIPICWDGQRDILEGCRRPTAKENLELLKEADKIAQDVMNHQAELAHFFAEEMA